jgi:hypothetical protein
MKTAKAKELLDKAIIRLGTLRADCDLTKLNKSTLLHIKAGDTTKPHDDTMGKLMRAAYGE